MHAWSMIIAHTRVFSAATFSYLRQCPTQCDGLNSLAQSDGFHTTIVTLLIYGMLWMT